MLNRGFIAIVVVIAISLVAVLMVSTAWYFNQHQYDSVDSFEECAKAVGQVLAIYPGQCTINGKTFIENVNVNLNLNANSNINTNADITTVDTSDWLTYENEEYGISFQYPNNWGVVKVTNNDYRNDERSYYEGQGVNITFENSTKPNIRLSSSDYRDFVALTSYNGGANLAQECSTPGVIEDYSYCVNKTVAGQNTFDRLRFDAPECSPMFIRESWLNIDHSIYKGLIISSILFTDGGWDCTSNDTQAWDSVTDSELRRLINRNNLTEEESALLQGMDKIIETFRFL
ncbi:MAG: hypothetical protein HZC01_00680 [Candidatus Kerfeldbacteria bacterium]|nr:hypothetical protein [Candidatus Kerfeldbacteria bacterium]